MRKKRNKRKKITQAKKVYASASHATVLAQENATIESILFFMHCKQRKRLRYVRCVLCVRCVRLNVTVCSNGLLRGLISRVVTVEFDRLK